MFELIVFVCIALFVLSLLSDTASRKPGVLYLLVLPIAILTLPLKLALDLMGSGRGRRKRR